MKIDCHCHIFDNACVPILGVLASRVGFAFGKRAFSLLEDLKEGKLAKPWLDYFYDLSVNPIEALRAFADPQEKDNLRFLLDHIKDFLAFLEIGTHDKPEILDRMKRASWGIDIWVPLMMDMSHAFPGSQSVMDFEGQRKVMSDLVLESGGQIMPFFAFDPRYIEFDPVERVKTAIESEGFVGVKLYPPLGYKPAGNENPEIEDKMMRLYSYCCQNEENPIPITAHCSWSGGVYSNERVPGVRDMRIYYRGMAHPKHWERALERFPSLKVNLAHFGGLGEWDARTVNVTPRENWAEGIIALIKKYDNVFTDLSYHGLPATDRAGDYRDVLLEKIEGIEDRVLLGSDWYMSRIQCSLNDYWAGFKNLFPQLFFVMTGDNALSFLKSEASAKYFPELFERNGRQIEGRFQGLFDC